MGSYLTKRKTVQKKEEPSHNSEGFIPRRGGIVFFTFHNDDESDHGSIPEERIKQIRAYLERCSVRRNVACCTDDSGETRFQRRIYRPNPEFCL